MGEDSSRLTLAQMQQYITDNNLPNKSSDTSTTGDIYDYVVEGLSATGATTEVMIELLHLCKGYTTRIFTHCP
jgi:hypothetical protein